MKRKYETKSDFSSTLLTYDIVSILDMDVWFYPNTHTVHRPWCWCLSQSKQLLLPIHCLEISTKGVVYSPKHLNMVIHKSKWRVLKHCFDINYSTGFLLIYCITFILPSCSSDESKFTKPDYVCHELVQSSIKCYGISRLRQQQSQTFRVCLSHQAKCIFHLL